MSLRKPTAALAAAAAALALAAPAPASAQITPAVYQPPYVFCASLITQIQAALASGNPTLANLVSQTFITLHCGGAAI